MVNGRPGSSLAGFEVVERLGEGGSGVVYRVRDEDGRHVALKVAKAELALSSRERERFLSEAERMQRVRHPSVITLSAAGALDDGSPYLVMPFLEGETLAARVARGPLEAAEALRIAREIGQGIEAIHAAGMLHRDIKPENVFLTGPEARAIVLDFGIARDVDGPATTTTREGRMRGTPAYMAPERFFGASPAATSEVYELAVTLYVMLAGSLPWAGDDRGFDERLDPPPPETRGALVPAHVSSVLMRALSTRPESRPQTIAAFLALLDAPVAVSAERQTEDVTTRPVPSAVATAVPATDTPPPFFETPPAAAVDVTREPAAGRKAAPMSRVAAAVMAVAILAGATAWVGARGGAAIAAELRDACLAPSCAGDLAQLSNASVTSAPSAPASAAPTAPSTDKGPPAMPAARPARSARPPASVVSVSEMGPAKVPPKAKGARDDDAILLDDR